MRVAGEKPCPQLRHLAADRPRMLDSMSDENRSEANRERADVPWELPNNSMQRTALRAAADAEALAPMNVNDTLHLLTTIVVASSTSGQSQGTGFFYQRLEPKTTDGPQWRQIADTWLITNRHVVLSRPDGSEAIPDSLSFHMRRIEANGLRWEAVLLDRKAVGERTKFHADREVDIAAINVHDLLIDKIKSESSKYAQWCAVHSKQFAGHNNIEIEASDDILVIGYPRGFYDEVNLFPIVKSGIIASRWGAHFGGKPYFLIDAKLFPGSSGSIVISKPTNLVVKDGQILHAKEKQFSFLGVFSGEPYRRERPVELDDMVIIQKSGYNVGVVWYAHPIEETVNDGVQTPSAK